MQLSQLSAVDPFIRISRFYMPSLWVRMSVFVAYQSYWYESTPWRRTGQNGFYEYSRATIALHVTISRRDQVNKYYTIVSHRSRLERMGYGERKTLCRNPSRHE